MTMKDCAKSKEKAIKLTSSSHIGLHFTAKRTIAAETPIFLEKPFAHDNEDFQMCACCLLKLDGQFIPCLKCTQTVYCHRVCASLHSTDWHSVACGGMLHVLRQIGPVAVLLFQMIGKAGGPRAAMEMYESRSAFSVEQYLSSEHNPEGKYHR